MLSPQLAIQTCTRLKHFSIRVWFYSIHAVTAMPTQLPTKAFEASSLNFFLKYIFQLLILLTAIRIGFNLT